MTRAIDVNALTRHFGNLVAVDAVDFWVNKGEVFGFLGPNGAGKTTTISMLTTLLKPSAGTATVAGHDIRSEQSAVRSSIGIVFQEPSLDDRLTARENLNFHGVLYNVPPQIRRERIDELLKLVDLDSRADDIVEKFSGGMKRRLEIARGLLHTPEILFLDEPTIGLDPQTRRNMWDHIKRLREETGTTIFMTTHYMDEAEFCNRIAIMDHAGIVALDTPEGLKRMVGGDVITVRTPDSNDLVDFLSTEPVMTTQRNGSIRIEVQEGAPFIPHLAREFKGRIDAIELRRPTLDDVFLKLTGRTIRESELDQVDLNRNRLRMMVRRRRGHG
ncbi:daunorubicin/doxorubicin resistance ATP-binding protein DrrA [bacterium BMS3Abin02]|nr:daunorubicin/doxorubicin resistance ATP-binding protein DrrA [bacterium BMS3Abin02]GBE21943.1 daunorubicin/doxorubicin resistance ATP-binding protein DrrA [bacterium BMS3Bbin01]HDH25347.1 ATP-binding cassette domain-containing protein [Actinomycetota bacterium]HDL48553.1 ATP-binding cassette domain-containing protein [Actinomycetota bacterium]